MTDTDPTPPTDTAMGPVFGRRAGTFDQRKTRRFGMEVETADERWDEHFVGWDDRDAGAVLGVMNARDDLGRANAIARLMLTTLRDDDGRPTTWVPPLEGETEDDPETPGEQRYVTNDDGQVLYRAWDDSLLTSQELTAYTRDVLSDGSSRARFGFIMDSVDHRVQLEALNELSEWIIGDVSGGRPTKRPTHSQRGPQRTGRGSGGR